MKKSPLGDLMVLFRLIKLHCCIKCQSLCIGIPHLRDALTRWESLALTEDNGCFAITHQRQPDLVLLQQKNTKKV